MIIHSLKFMLESIDEMVIKEEEKTRKKQNENKSTLLCSQNY